MAPNTKRAFVWRGFAAVKSEAENASAKYTEVHWRCSGLHQTKEIGQLMAAEQQDEDAHNERRRRAVARFTLAAAPQAGIALWRDERGGGILNWKFPDNCRRPSHSSFALRLCRGHLQQRRRRHRGSSVSLRGRPS